MSDEQWQKEQGRGELTESLNILNQDWPEWSDIVRDKTYLRTHWESVRERREGGRNDDIWELLVALLTGPLLIESFDHLPRDEPERAERERPFDCS
jgi:hypothetical protein